MKSIKITGAICLLLTQTILAELPGAGPALPVNPQLSPIADEITGLTDLGGDFKKMATNHLDRLAHLNGSNIFSHAEDWSAFDHHISSLRTKILMDPNSFSARLQRVTDSLKTANCAPGVVLPPKPQIQPNFPPPPHLDAPKVIKGACVYPGKQELTVLTNTDVLKIEVPCELDPLKFRCGATEVYSSADYFAQAGYVILYNGIEVEKAKTPKSDSKAYYGNAPGYSPGTAFNIADKMKASDPRCSIK